MNQENISRAVRANKALKGYVGYQALSEAISDLLTDLRHLCDQKKIDFATQDRLARQHYLAEKEG